MKEQRGKAITCAICEQVYTVSTRTMAQRQTAYDVHRKTSEKHKALIARYIEQ